jgi:RNA polymerase sigma factor (TIGR02999 family)
MITGSHHRFRNNLDGYNGDSAMNASDDLSEMLAELQTGGKEALERMTPLVYGELHRIARRVWGTQEPGHTLQPTVLIHEAYMKMVRQKDRTFQSRAHFYAVAAMAMRQVLVNHAEASVAAKRGSKKNSVPLDEELISSLQEESDVLALHDALKSLAEMDPRKGRVVEMRYFGGLSIEETAEALGVSTITVTRDWVAARAWLARELGAS